MVEHISGDPITVNGGNGYEKERIIQNGYRTFS